MQVGSFALCLDNMKQRETEGKERGGNKFNYLDKGWRKGGEGGPPLKNTIPLKFEGKWSFIFPLLFFLFPSPSFPSYIAIQTKCQHLWRLERKGEEVKGGKGKSELPFIKRGRKNDPIPFSLVMSYPNNGTMYPSLSSLHIFLSKHNVTVLGTRGAMFQFEMHNSALES